MNRTERNQFWLQYERRRNAVEKRWKGRIYQALQSQVNQAVNYLRWNGVQETKRNLNHVVTFERVGIIIKALYRQAGLYQANTMYGTIKTFDRKYRGFGFNEEWTEAILKFFELYLLNKAVLPITETTKQIIGKILDQAATEGWSVDQTVNEILSKAADINKSRARVIVRTETGKAMSYGNRLAESKSTIVLDKMWIDAKDNRERPSHRVCGNKGAIDINDTYPNGLMMPHDQEGSAEEVIACRCTEAYVPKRDASGRPLRKPKPEPVNNLTVNDTIGVLMSMNQ